MCLQGIEKLIILILTVILLLLILVSVVLLFFTKNYFYKQTKLVIPTVTEIQKNQDSVYYANSPTEVALITYTPIPIETYQSIKNLSMPILMYHHIRTYNIPSDPIGKNLSVSPKVFASQLQKNQK